MPQIFGNDSSEGLCETVSLAEKLPQANAVNVVTERPGH